MLNVKRDRISRMGEWVWGEIVSEVFAGVLIESVDNPTSCHSREDGNPCQKEYFSLSGFPPARG